MKLEPLQRGEVRVLVVEIGPRDCADEALEAFPEFRLLNDEEQIRARRFVRPRDRRRFVVCRGSLRLILGQLIAVAADRIAFRSGAGGKPELDPDLYTREARELRFNVTHSDELALIALGNGPELGVDLERLRPIHEAERIVESYFTTAERAQFLSIEPSQRELAFLRGWTRKEAVLKARGVGLAGLASSFETMFGTGDLPARFTPADPIPRVAGWDLWEVQPRDGYVAALAVEAAAGIRSSDGPRDPASVVASPARDSVD
jgi:4'-phosphopantetheinyl transferase